jgi:hypothetical protein
MTHTFPRFCPQCGSPREPGQRFCPRCGTSLDMAANNPTAGAFDQQSTLASPPAPDGPPLAPAGLAAHGSTSRTPTTGPTTVFDTSAPTSSMGSGGRLTVANTSVPGIPPPPPPASLFAEPTPPGTYTRAPKRSRAGLFALILLLILVLGGVGGYVVLFRGGNQRGTGTASQPTTTGSGSTTGRNTPVTGGPATESLNLQFTYASEEITITSVREAASFSDDLQPHQGLVRITLNENNPSHWHAGFGLFSDVAHLLLPDGSTATVNMVKSDGGLDANTSRMSNWLDFAVPNPALDLSKLVLRMGTATEHQMDIPLMPSADLSQYQDKTITPHTPVSYGGLNWTLQSVTLSLSGAKGAQATAGMRYVILSLRVDNPTSHDVVIGFPEDYLRLKSTDVTSAPIVDTMTLPGHAPANTANVTGTVFFLMPGNDTAFTLEWLVSQNPVYDPVSDTQVNTPIQFR